MGTTTCYGSWNNHGDPTSLTVEETIGDYLSGGDAEWRERVESTGALYEMADSYREAINAALPEGVTLAGNEFYGPYYGDNPVGGENPSISDIIGRINVGAIIDQHDPDLAT